MDISFDNGLYPAFEAYKTGGLDVGDGHTLYFELCGNVKGIPVVYLHGGPGAGCTEQQRRYFDPNIYHVVQFDQRGAGHSTPFSSTKNNTTAHLIVDIEKLRIHLGIKRWLVSGGSWGATLALAYGQRHPTSCLGFVLRGVFLGTQPEIEWFLGGIKKVFPEAFNEFSQHAGGMDGAALLDAYYQLLFDDDPACHVPAARAWAKFEIGCSTLLPQELYTYGGQVYGDFAVALARLEAHYFKHNFFLAPDQICQNIDVIKHLPAIFVQGRYDMICPMVTVHRLRSLWAESTLTVVPDAGHSGMELGICRALVRGTKKMAKLLT